MLALLRRPTYIHTPLHLTPVILLFTSLSDPYDLYGKSSICVVIRLHSRIHIYIKTDPLAIEKRILNFGSGGQGATSMLKHLNCKFRAIILLY